MTAFPGLEQPVLIDGGLATQCEAMGHNIDGSLWSAKLLLENPQAIVDAHRAFLEAGARIIATASYQASRHGLARVGLSSDEADEVLLESVRLAMRARDEFLAANPEPGYRPLVAASIGPWGAAQHDGSEYTGEYDVARSELEAFHRQRLGVFERSESDLIACETIPAIEEAQVLCDLLNDVSKPAWVSFCCRDDAHISDGTDIEAAAELFRDHPRVFAVGANCTAPEFITPLVRRLTRVAPGKDIVVYPNSGETYCAEDNTWSGDDRRGSLDNLVAEWAEAGATLIGGCCRVGPEQIKAMAATGTFTS